MHIKEPWSKIRENSPHIIVNLWTFFMRYINGLSPVLLIAGPKIIQPKRDTDYGQNVKSKQLKENNVNHRKENGKKNLGCLPRSSMFNVVSSTTLNLNVLEDSSSYDRLLYFV